MATERKQFIPGLVKPCQTCVNKLPDGEYPVRRYPCKAVQEVFTPYMTLIPPEIREAGICESYRPTFLASLRNFLEQVRSKINPDNWVHPQI